MVLADQSQIVHGRQLRLTVLPNNCDLSQRPTQKILLGGTTTVLRLV